MNRISLIGLFLIFALQVFGQNSCEKRYYYATELSDSSIVLLDNRKKSIGGRIRRSKKIAKKALEILYDIINDENCNLYSSAINKIIDIEFKLGNHEKAESLALERIKKLYPNYQDIKNSMRINQRYLTDLVRINSSIKSGYTYYDNVRKSKGLVLVCGTISYFREVEGNLATAKYLYDNYGSIYCLRYLENIGVILYEEDERVKPLWEEIYELLINSLIEYHNPKDLLNGYTEISNFQQLDKPIYLSGSGNRGKFYLKIIYFPVYFKSKVFYHNGKRSLTEPKNFEELKLRSDLYNKLLEYAS